MESNVLFTNPGFYEEASFAIFLRKTSFPLEMTILSKICKQISQMSRTKSISESETIELITWLIKAFNQNNGHLNILNALYDLLKINHNFSQVIDNLVGNQGILLKTINNQSYSNLEKVIALKCLQNLIFYHDNSQNQEKHTYLSKIQLELCAKSITNVLFTTRQQGETEESHCEMIIYACKSLTQLYSNDSEINKNLEDIIGACKYWMLYSLKDLSLEKPQRIAPSQQTIAEIKAPLMPRKSGKQRKLRRHRNIKPIPIQDSDSSITSDPCSYKAANMNVDCTKVVYIQSGMTSESDLSDSENARSKNVHMLQTKLRISVLNLLTVVIKSTEKHIIFGYWWALLPDVKSDMWNIGGIGLLISLESTTTGRSAAFTVLLSLLTSSKLYLLQADTSKHMTMSFMPFSVALGISLENLHKLLSSQLVNEKCVPVLVNILKCTAGLIQATPYNKLGGNILIPVIESVHQLLLHNDWTIQVASLIVMGCIISINPPMEDVSFYLINGIEKNTAGISNLNMSEKCTSIANKNVNSTVEKESSVTFNNMNWLLAICLKNFGYKIEGIEISTTAIVPTRLESLQVLSTIALRYFDAMLLPSLKTITKIICLSLEDNSTEICLHAAKCVGSIGEAIQNSDFLSHDSMSEEYVTFWSHLLHGSLTTLIQGELHVTARAAACDSLGTIGEVIITKLDEKLKILIATLLLGCSADDDYLIRASAVRAMAVCVVYQYWREDPCLISDCVETALRISNEPILAVKIKAIWALANVTDALLLNENNSEIEPIDHGLFYKLLEASIKASNENDKIKMNAVRAIGNMVFLINSSILNYPNMQSLTYSALQKLEQCAINGNNMKVRWNACHALGKILKNSMLYKHLGNWQEKILESLCKIIETCRNLKVCIHAATALCSPSDRIQYGTFYVNIWSSVMGALNSIYHIEDFTEYQHKNTLIDQLCITLSHLTCMITIDDLADLYNPFCFYWETVSKLLQEVIQRSEPQSLICSKLLDAAKYVTTELYSSNEKHTQNLAILQNMFIWDY